MAAAGAPDPRPRTVAVHARNGIGDLVWHIPYLRALAAHSAGGRLSLIYRPSCRAPDVLAGEDCFDELIAYEHKARSGGQGRDAGLAAQWRFAMALRERRFERLVVFSPRLRYALLGWLAGIPRRAGFGFDWSQRLLLNQPPYLRPHQGAGNWVYPEATAFAVAQGWCDAPITPRMAVRDDARAEAARLVAALPPRRVALAIGASNPRRNWGAERFAALSDALAAEGCGVLLLGGPAESALADAVIAGIDASRRAQVLGCVHGSLQLTAALLRESACCVGNDTGALNMAAANARPTLGLFGASPPLLHDPLLEAAPATAMDAITVESVLRWVRDKLKATPAAA